MALGNLATKMRAALRLPSVARGSPPLPPPPPPAVSPPAEGARGLYMYHRELLENLRGEIAETSVAVKWARRAAKVATWTYRLSTPLVAAEVVLRGIAGSGTSK